MNSPDRNMGGTLCYHKFAKKLKKNVLFNKDSETEEKNSDIIYISQN